MSRILMEIESPLARELAEYEILREDVSTSMATFTLWFEKYAPDRHSLPPEQKLIGQSLFRDATVMFVGCFDKSAPVSLTPELVYNTSDGSLTFFYWLKDIRDSYAAHKFGPLRQCITGVFIDNGDTVVMAGHISRIYAGPMTVQGNDLIEIVKIAGRFAETKIAELSLQLTREAQQMSKAEIAALKPAQTRDVSFHEIRVSRARFNRAPT